MRVRAPKFLAVVLIVSGLLLAAIAPAGARPGVSVAATHLSPRLLNGFPCGAGTRPALYAFTKWINNQVPAMSNCNGDIYQVHAAPANTAVFLGVGTAATGPYAGKRVTVQGAGKINAVYKYEEPCQIVAGRKAAIRGEAYGTITLTLSNARWIVGTTVTNGPVKTTVKFWWSRVGVTAIVGLRTFTADLGSNGSNDINEPGALGLAVALFSETVEQVQRGCTPGPTPAAGSIRITSATLGVSA